MSESRGLRDQDREFGGGLLAGGDHYGYRRSPSPRQEGLTVPTSVVAADKKKGAVVKANASKAASKAAVPKTAGESSKKASVSGDVSTRATAVKAVTATKKAGATGAKAAPAPKSLKAAVPKPTGKAGTKAPGESAAKSSAKSPSAAKDGSSRSKVAAAPAVPGKSSLGATAKAGTKAPVEGAKPEATHVAPAKAPAANKAAPAPAKVTTKTLKAAPTSRKAPAAPPRDGATRPGGGGLGADASKKVVSEGYSKDERFLATQRGALMRERATYLEQAASLKAEAESLVEEMEPGDIQFDDESGEGGTVTVDRERDLALSAQAMAAVEEIDHTLAKMDNGTYGICENCGRLIPKARLEALPYARLCIECKSGGLSRR